MKKMMILFLMLLPSIACNLAAQEAAKPTAIPILSQPLVTLTSTSTIQPSSTPTVQPSSNNAGSQPVQAANPVVRCTPRSDWQTYSVAAGDTMFSIAQKVNSTVDNLALANCLDDPSNLRVGQQIRVPQAITNAPLTNMREVDVGIYEAGTIEFSNLVWVENDVYLFKPDELQTITWVGAPVDELTQVEFSYIPDGGNFPISLGTDTNWADGVTTQWLVPFGVSGQVNVGGRIHGELHHVAMARTTQIRALETSTCEFNPFGIGGDVPVYSETDVTSTVLGEVSMGSRYELASRQPDWYEIRYAEQTGWVQDYRGGLVGNCNAFR